MPHDDRRNAGSPNLTDVLQDAVRALVTEGRDRIAQIADDGRELWRLRALQRERDALWMRLGKVAYQLSTTGEIAHPALDRARARLDELDQTIAAMRAAGHADPPTSHEE